MKNVNDKISCDIILKVRGKVIMCMEVVNNNSHRINACMNDKYVHDEICVMKKSY